MCTRDAFVAARMDADAVAVLSAADVLEHRLTATLEHLEWHPPCEGREHARAIQGHVPDQTASYYLVAPCHGPRLVICAGRRDWILGIGLLQCGICKVETLVERWRIEPIGVSQ